MARLWEPPEEETEPRGDWIASARGRLFGDRLMRQFPELRRTFNAAIRSGLLPDPSDVIGEWLDGRIPEKVTHVNDLVLLLEDRFHLSAENVTRLPPRPPTSGDDWSRDQ